MLSIRYKLRDLADIEPWKGEDGPSLSWFGLSDGWYCLETSQGRLLEFADAGGPQWCDYQVARLFLDLADIWPSISAPIPDDIFAYFAAWHQTTGGMAGDPAAGFYDAVMAWSSHFETPELYDDAESAQRFDDAMGWLYGLRLDTFYLNEKPALYSWRAGSQIYLAWDGTPNWPPDRVRLAFPVEAVRESLASFFHDFLAEMDARVAEIERNGWRGKECRIDVPRLIVSQHESEELAANNLWRTRAFDWDLIRLSIARFDKGSFGG